MKELREKIKDILVNFAVHTNKCHKKQVEPNLNPWADLFEQLLLERDKEVIDKIQDLGWIGTLQREELEQELKTLKKE